MRTAATTTSPRSGWAATTINGAPCAATACPSATSPARKDTDPYRTFERWAETLPKLLGNPLYHWTYLELKRYFGITDVLNAKSAKDIYDRCNARLKDPDMSVRGLIDQSNVKLICTTDDPADTLEWHKKIKPTPPAR